MAHEQSWAHRTLTRFFGVPEEINGGGICPTYLYRWVLGKFGPGWKVYVHHFVGNDWSLDYHDHPKDFMSIGLWGSYEEHTPVDDAVIAAFIAAESDPDISRIEVSEFRVFRAPWVRCFPADWKHRIETPSGSCWTLVIVGPIKRSWGFWHQGKFVEWKEYVRGADYADVRQKRKNCGDV